MTTRLIFRGLCSNEVNPIGPRYESAVFPLLLLLVRILKGAWMSVSCECWELLGRGVSDELITHTEESYRVWCV